MEKSYNLRIFRIFVIHNFDPYKKQTFLTDSFIYFH